MVWLFFSEETNAPKHTAVEDEAEKVVEEAFECDYERDCTALYLAIESAIEVVEFEPIVKFLDTGYWPGAFFADAISPADQARTWVTRFDPVDTNKVKWSQLPLHLAIVCGAPTSIIGRLVKLYPQALRCTDDQHMLPLHLALRHGADDEVVAYLLMQFPDAVNAKGKNGRSAVNCALRAKDKLRGKILEIFVEKSKGKKSASIVKEQQQLKAELQAKTDEVTSLKADFEALAASFESMKALKNNVETDLLTKIQDLEQAKAELEAEAANKIERLQSEKLLESLELQKKLEGVVSSKAEIEMSEKQLRESEAALRSELDVIHGRVSKSVSPEDWQPLKAEVEGLKAYRFERNRSETKTQIDTLKGELEKTMQEVKKADSMAESVDTRADLHSELKSLQKTVHKLEKSETSAKTTEELNALRNEVEVLRAELKDRSEASKVRVELAALKKAMETELKNSQGKTKEELAALRKAVKTANIDKLDNKTNAELAALKSELESLKKGITNKELVTKTKTALDELCENLETEIKSADPKSLLDLASMKQTADHLKADLEKSDSNDGVIAVKNTVEQMKDELKKKDATMKIMSEVNALKSTVEAELKNSEGKTQEELLRMKKQIKSLNEKELATKDVDELAKIKNEVTDVKTALKEIEKASKVQQELDLLKKTLATEMNNSAAKAEKELAMMKKAVDEVNMEQKESKNLKKSLAEEIKQANKATEKELIKLKKALDAIDVKKLESTNKDGWDAIRTEMEALKAGLAAKQVGKESIASQLELIKKTVEGLNLDKIEKKADSEFLSLREEMNVMRANLKQKDEGEAVLKKEIEALKKSDAKRKVGLKKFFSRHFSARKNNEQKEATAMASAGGVSVAESSARDLDAVSTIRPPSMGKHRYGADAGSSDDDSIDGSTATEQVLAKLSVSFMEDAPAVETVHTEDSSQQKTTKEATPTPEKKSPSTKPPKSLSSFRKVKSMGPSIASPKAATVTTIAAQPVPMSRTMSKTVEEENGDVELEKVDTIEDDVLVPTPAQ